MTTAIQRLRAVRRAQKRGVTLIEVLIVVAILAMVAGGVAVFALPRFKKAQETQAATDAATIRTAVQTWQATNADTSCPTVSQLKQEKFLDTASKTDDPWGGTYSIACEADEVIVGSAGPDQKKGSKDDIRVPKGAAAAGE